MYSAGYCSSNDTVFVEDAKDPRYLRYLDSLQAYKIAYSVAKNIADTIKIVTGDNSLDAYFLNNFAGNTDTLSSQYFYNLQRNEDVEIGHISDSYKGMKNEEKFPWEYLEQQYKRLDSIKIQPHLIMQGGELPNVYVYLLPKITVIHKVVKRFTVIDPTIHFYITNDGKTKTPYITKYYYIEVDKNNRKIDSIEKLDPIRHEHIDF